MKILREIRPYQLDDAATLAAIANIAKPYPWSKEVFRDCVVAEYPGWVLTLDEQIKGYTIIKVAAEEAELLNICVDPVAQGVGHGTDLLNTAIIQAAARGAEHIFLEVRISNDHAIALYKKLGFNEVGVRKNYYPTDDGREDAMIMFRPL